MYRPRRISSLLTAMVLCAATLVVAAPGAEAARQPLIGADGHGRVRVLDRDQHVVRGTPALPSNTDGTLLSPDGRRFAAWSFETRRLTIRGRRAFRPTVTVPIDQGPEVYWPTRDR